MTIEGDYTLFVHLETVYLGSLARRSLIMRNVQEVVEAARGKSIFYFPARHDHWLVQTGDGWAAHVAGAIGVSHRRAGVVVGRPRDRHGAPRPDRGLRRRHRAGGTQVRRPVRRRDERHRARRLREHSARTALEVADALRRPTCGASRSRHLGDAGRRVAVARARGLRPDRRQRAPGREGPLRARRRGSTTRCGSSCPGASTPSASARSRRRRARRRLRGRLFPDPRPERLHGRRGQGRRADGAKVGRHFAPNPRLARVE